MKSSSSAVSMGLSRAESDRPSILLVDNYDSFVHNLGRYLRLAGALTTTVRNDRIDVADIVKDPPDGVVISPGPGHPRDAGVSVDLIRKLPASVPMLGVCLGHQAIALAFGGRVPTGPPVHGSASEVFHDSTGLMSDCSSPTPVGRYHSLCLDRDSLPDELVVTGATSDGIIMAVQHRHRPIFGLQFHPESVLTHDGQRMIDRFVQIVLDQRERSKRKDERSCDKPQTRPMQDSTIDRPLEAT